MARIIQPIKHLNGYKDKDVELQADIYDIHEKDPMDWLQVAKNYDAIYFGYLNSPWGYAAMGAMARGHNRKIILDFDDSLWHIKESNPAHKVYKKGGEAIRNFTAICNDVDYITTTNDYLRNIIISYTNKPADRIKVFPNCVDFKLYSYRPQFKNDGQIMLTHYGSSTHWDDLEEAEFVKGMDRLMSEYPNISIRFIGAFSPRFRNRWGRRYENTYGHQDVYEWIKTKFPTFMDETDIVICPLVDDVYNRAKSDIKRSEVATALKPFVAQEMRQYEEVIEDGVDGFLCRTSGDWYSKIKKLIESPELRKSMAEKAFERVKKERNIETNIAAYAEWFKEILEV